MGYDSFNISGPTHRNRSRTRLILSLVIGVALGFTCGILVGHYGIEKSNDSNSNAGAEQVVSSSDDSTTMTPSASAVTSTTPATISETLASDPDLGSTTVTGLPTGTTSSSSASDGVFLSGVPEAINRDANPNITDWILGGINASKIAENLKILVQEPHVAGTENDFEQADMLKNFWLDNGLDVAVTTPYDILLSYPDDNVPNNVRVFNDTAVIMTSPDYEVNLTAEERPWEWPFPYLGYSGSGTVNGSIVYVNYAREVDFNYLASQNITVSGNIVLARYGRGFRGDKVRLAEERGAIAVILYSDPSDYIAPWVNDDYYPNTVWIPPSAVPRGTIFMGTGDPLTPGHPAIASAFRYDETDPEANLPKTPAIPISFEFAKQLIERLGGPEAPAEWTGRLLNGTNYRLGPGFSDTTLVAQVSVHTRNERRTSYNAFGMIKGESEPDRYVMLGNHRDSWVLGAIDPSSGTATMMELSRVLGQLVREGKWRPRRSIIFCSWGAEEFALIGSTEWIEENSKVLDSRSIAYINLDIAVTGNYSIRGVGSPPVFTAMYNAAKKVQVPSADGTDNRTVFETWTERRPLTDPATGTDIGLPVIRSPGESSDYATFQIRSGIPCADFRYDQDYAGEGILFYPLYHTGYETYHAVSELIDPGFLYHATMGKLSGELLRDLADSKILPFNMSDYALFLRHYAYALKSNATGLMETHGLNITELDRVIDLYETEAATFHDMVNGINRNNPFEVRRVNDQMMQVERAFLDPTGLPGRDQMYRHLIHSTALHYPFPGDSFPGMQDAVYKVRAEPENTDYIRELQLHFSVLVATIQGAAYSLKDSTAFMRETL